MSKNEENVCSFKLMQCGKCTKVIIIRNISLISQRFHSSYFWRAVFSMLCPLWMFLSFRFSQEDPFLPHGSLLQTRGGRGAFPLHHLCLLLLCESHGYSYSHRKLPGIWPWDRYSGVQLFLCILLIAVEFAYSPKLTHAGRNINKRIAHNLI